MPPTGTSSIISSPFFPFFFFLQMVLPLFGRMLLKGCSSSLLTPDFVFVGIRAQTTGFHPLGSNIMNTNKNKN